MKSAIKALSESRTLYIVVQGKTVDQLVKAVNDIIEHGWHSEGVIISGWRTAGGITWADNMYLQSLIHEP